MNVNLFKIKGYEKRTLGQRGKNKANTNPIQSQTNPTCRGVASGEAGSNPILSADLSAGGLPKAEASAKADSKPTQASR